MGIDEEVLDDIIECIDEDDFQTFSKLVRVHWKLANDFEKKSIFRNAIRTGIVKYISFLHQEMGVDINEPYEEFQPEGAVGEAAARGKVDALSYLLDNGGEINLVVTPKMQVLLGSEESEDLKEIIRCQALTTAAMNNNLDIVKLLVERGADLTASWANINAMSTPFQEVKDYLTSVGMKPVPK